MKPLREFGESIKRRRALLLILALAVAVRVYRLDLPFLEPFNSLSRQAICATVARNYLTRGFNLFYPEIDEGSGPYLYNAELPINTYLMALMYQAIGGVREWAARSVSVGFSLGWLAALYLLTRRLADRRAAMVALAFAAFSPLSVALSRSIQPDIAMVSLGTVALLLYERHLDRPSILRALGAALAFAAAALVKIHALHLLLPMVWLAWRRKGWRYFLGAEPYLLATAALPALAWYAWMARLGDALPLFYKPYHYFPDDAAPGTTYWSFFTLETLALNAKFFCVHLMTPLGAGALAAGLLRKGKTDADSFYAVWFAAAAAYLLAAWPTAVRQSYYQLALLTPGVYFAARGLLLVWGAGGGAARLSRRLVAGAVVLSVPLAAYYYSKLYFLTPEGRAVVEAGKAADRLLPREALVVASYGSSPILLYYANRRGWTLDISRYGNDELLLRLDKMSKGGASYFVVASSLWARRSDVLRKSVFESQPAIAEGGGWGVYGLRSDR